MAYRPKPFFPAAVSATIAVTNSSQRVALSIIGSSVYLANVGTTECFIAFGNASVVVTAGAGATSAADGGMSIPGGFNGVVSSGGQSNIAAICAGSGSTTLRVTPGDGE